MFKYKRVDQEQELEEGEISDDNLQVPPSTNNINAVQKKSKPTPPVVQQQGSEQQYVIEQVKIRPPSPYADRKKERKDLKADEKNYRYEQKIRQSRSPENSNFPTNPIIPPIPPMQPVNPYYGYPPSNMYSYSQTTPDQRQMRYVQMGQHQQMKINYPQNQYPQRMPIQNQWHPQVPVSPNKIHNQNQIPDFYQRQPMYGYNNSNTPNYPHLPNMNCSQPNKYSNTPPSSMMSMPNLPNISMSQNMGQQYYQHNYSHQQQEHNKNYMQEQRRKQQQEQQNRQKQRQKKIDETRRSIKQKLVQCLTPTSPASNPTITNQKQLIGQILVIIKSIIPFQDYKSQDIDTLHTKIQLCKLRSKIYQILTTLQLPKLLQKLKIKQLQSKLIQQNKKNQAAAIFQKMSRKDPRVRVS